MAKAKIKTVQATQISEINPTKLSYKLDGKLVMIKPDKIMTKKDIQDSLKSLKAMLKKWGSYHDITVETTGFVSFFTKKDFIRVIGYWDYSKQAPSILSDLKELPKELRSDYLSIRNDVNSLVKGLK